MILFLWTFGSMAYGTVWKGVVLMKRWVGVLAVCLIGLMFLAPGVCGATETYEANWESLDARPTPQWWTDAKFGIFIHWGPYAVPSWSVRGQYSEWYWNRIMGDKAKNSRGYLWDRFSLCRLCADVPG